MLSYLLRISERCELVLLTATDQKAEGTRGDH